MVVEEVLQTFPYSPSEKMALQLTSYQYNGKIMRIAPVKACQPDIRKHHKRVDYLYMSFLPAIHSFASKSI